MSRVLMAVALTGVLAVSACATPTPYQPLQKSGLSAGGYSDLQISTDRYRISFEGNAVTNRDVVERYLLYHASEVTLRDGYDWFMLTNRRTDTKVSGIEDPYYGWTPEWAFYGRGGWGRRYPGYWGGGFGYGPYGGLSPYDTEITRFKADAEILMGHGKMPVNNPAAFDARDVQAHLAPTIAKPVPKA